MIHITPVSVVDDGEEHIEQDEEAAKDVEDEEPGTFKNGILRVFFLIGPSIAPKSKTSSSQLEPLFLFSESLWLAIF